MEDRKWMERAIELAKKGYGHVNPNPLVGAVIVKDGRIIGEGYHTQYGKLHAEREALAHVTEDPKGATIYVTLEPCCHHGKQPPCTQALIDAGIAKVVIGSRDPNPVVSGGGVKVLKAHGIEVVNDFMRHECDAINDIFFHYITTKRPYVTMKYAMTADGKIATKTGDSKWITGEASRNKVQMERKGHMAIMVGIGTVLADDPMLTVRIPDSREIIRVIVDSKLRIPLDSQIVRTAKEHPTIVACALSDKTTWKDENDEEYKGCTENELCKPTIECRELNLCKPHKNNCSADSVKDEYINKLCKLKEAGVSVICCPDQNGQVDLDKLMEYLGNENIDSVYVEGGGTLNESMLSKGLVNELHVYIGPKIFGGHDAKGPVAGIGIEQVKDAVMLTAKEISVIGNEVCIKYKTGL